MISDRKPADTICLIAGEKTNCINIWKAFTLAIVAYIRQRQPLTIGFFMFAGLITNGKYWTTECIRHPKRRLCSCCPNGMHIDVDFDIFYKTLTKMQRNNVESPTKQFKHFKRKQDPTFDVLLGYHNHPTTNIDEIVYKVKCCRIVYIL